MTIAFRTPYKECRRSFTLTPERSVLLLGSCFTDNIGARMLRSRWDVLPNPCGTLFNPMSIARALQLSMDSSKEPHWCEKGFSWDFPTLFTGKAQCLEALADTRRRLQDSQALIATFGTAKVYVHKQLGRVVANCHKHPADEFEVLILSPEELAEEWRKIIREVLPPHLRLILTVSPVRHVRDGFEDNSLSKASLRLLCRMLKEEFPERVEYFPSYEIVTDDLRDYRFYDEDMVHPSPVAIEYIWEIFTREFLSPEHRDLLKEGEALTRREHHISLHPGSPEDMAFRETTREMLRTFHAAHPTML